MIDWFKNIFKSYPPLAIGVMAGALALAAVSGGLVATALGTSSQTPTKTVTVDVGTGPAGPAGPSGPTGPAGAPGAESCIAGSTFGKLVINAKGGQVSIYTCIVD